MESANSSFHWQGGKRKGAKTVTTPRGFFPQNTKANGQGEESKSLHLAKQKESAADAYLTSHPGSISEIENLTGVDLALPDLLPKLDGKTLKRAVESELWPRN